jgi:arginyl-tRNA synthetase
MKEELKKIIEKAVKEFGEIPDFSIEVPSDKKFGDYSTNVALVLAKKIGKSPIETANLIKDKIRSDILKDIKVAGPGFINFFISNNIFIDSIKSVGKNFGKGNNLKGKKIIIDYTDPNLFKEFHVGHLMNNSIGESLSRIFEFEGAKVKRVCYQSDIGLNVAKAVYGMQQMDWESLKLDDGKKIKELGSAYAFGSNKYEIDEDAKKKIIEINKKIFEKSDYQINKLYSIGKKISLEHFDKIYKKLDTKFDELISESQVISLGKKIVEKGLAEGIFEKGDKGAVIFKGEKYGLHTRVFINSEGLPTYEAKDLGLAEFKDHKYKYDQSVVITASEQNDYFKVMLCAMNKVAPKLAEKTKHIGHGMLRLPEGKMSSRTGKVITGESLIEKVEELVGQKIKDRELSNKEKLEVLETVAVGAIRYSILKQSIGSDIIYDFDKSISFEGDSGPYLQYSYTRAVSILRKAKAEGIRPSFKNIPAEITELEKAISYFPETISDAQKSYEPHLLVLYLTDLAGKFNSYYAKNKIVDKKDEFSPYKVALTKAFSIVMKNGMWMLGIKTLEKM